MPELPDKATLEELHSDFSASQTSLEGLEQTNDMMCAPSPHHYLSARKIKSLKQVILFLPVCYVICLVSFSLLSNRVKHEKFQVITIVHNWENTLALEYFSWENRNLHLQKCSGRFWLVEFYWFNSFLFKALISYSPWKHQEIGIGIFSGNEMGMLVRKLSQFYAKFVTDLVSDKSISVKLKGVNVGHF